MSTDERNILQLLALANPVPTDAVEADVARSRAVRSAIMSDPSARPMRSAGRSLRGALPSAALVVVVLAGAASLIGVLSGSEPNALAIAKTDRYITLRIEDPAASAAQMNRELRDRRIDVEVELVPVLPAEVGHWVGGRAVWPGVADKGDQHRLGDERIRELNAAARLQEVVRDRQDPATMRIPAQFKGYLLLYAGRDARAGEKPWINGNPPGAR
jgi:hypothetical protein